MSDSDLLPEVQLERMNPTAIRRAMAAAPVVYLPLGAIEWHGEHLPVGLDALTAHGICIRAARRTGGLVFPPLYYGMSATIGHHPWTILAEDAEAWLHPLRVTLRRLSAFGVRQAVVYSGHFALNQLTALRQLAAEHATDNSGTRLLVLSVRDGGSIDPAMPPDHGGLFETSLLSAMHPGLVQLGHLPGETELLQPDPDGPHRRDPAHPLFGILGRDPRQLDEARARVLADQLEATLVSAVTGEQDEPSR